MLSNDAFGDFIKLNYAYVQSYFQLGYPKTEELSWPSYFFLNPRLYKPFLKVIIKQSMCLDCRAMIKCTCYSLPYLLEVHISLSCFEKLHPLIFSFLYRLFCFIKWRLYINSVIFELKSASWQSCTYDKPAYIKICHTFLFTRQRNCLQRKSALREVISKLAMIYILSSTHKVIHPTLWISSSNLSCAALLSLYKNGIPNTPVLFHM